MVMDRHILTALDQTIALARTRQQGSVPIIGVAGSQGSGKTTLVRAYAAGTPRTAHFSLDDVYLQKSDRHALARDIHPLFATRGPPGTHDMVLFHDALTALETAPADGQVALPAFDKVSDERLARTDWPVFPGRPDIILVDGWCLGALPETEDQLRQPVNRLETEEDSGGIWRRYANNRLDQDYRIAFSRLDAILYLRPPAFSVILDWRCQQEEGLIGGRLGPSDRARIGRFIQHYERITRRMMAGGCRADVEIWLDPVRAVTEVKSSRHVT